MSALQIISLASLALGAAAIVWFVWLDSLRFGDARVAAAETPRVSQKTADRLALQAAADRVIAETERLPRAA